MNAPPKLLIVDDTPKNIKLLADLLEVKGYRVLTAASGGEALKKLESDRPDLVLLDVVMPEMSGYEVCRRMRERVYPVSSRRDGYSARPSAGARQGYRGRSG